MGRCRQTGAGALAVSLAMWLGGACGDPPSDEAGAPEPGPIDVEQVTVDAPVPLSPPVVAVGDVLLAVSADEAGEEDGAPGGGGTTGGPAATEVPATADGESTAGWESTAGEDATPLDRADTLWRSRDGGATWEQVELPGAPGRVGLAGPEDAGGGAVVTGRALTEHEGFQVASGDAYVWSSRDGTDWTGGRVAGPGPALGDVNVFEAEGFLIAALHTGSSDPLDGDRRLRLLRSGDGGATWTPAELPDLDTSSGASAVREVSARGDGTLLAAVYLPHHVSVGSDGEVRSVPALRSVDGGRSWELADCPLDLPPESHTCVLGDRTGDLRTVGAHVSSDGGGTWQVIEIRADACSGDPDRQGGCRGVEDVVELDSGGWAARTSGELTSATGYDTLVRSADGSSWESWEQIDPPEHCRVERGNHTVRAVGPVEAGEGFLVGYSCFQPGPDTYRSGLRLLDADGSGHRALDGARVDGERLRRPVRTSGGLAVPAVGDRSHHVARLLHVTW